MGQRAPKKGPYPFLRSDAHRQRGTAPFSVNPARTRSPRAPPRRAPRLPAPRSPWCRGPSALIALIEEAAVIGRILGHLGLPTETPAPRPARAAVPARIADVAG